MNRLLILALIVTGGVIAAASAPPNARAAEPITIRTNTAGELAEVCGARPSESAADAKLNFCRGFAQGAIDVELHHDHDKKPFCFPNPAPSRASTMNEFVSWVRAMPDRRSMPSSEALFQFLAERFPCK